jgi:hypothetical protein
LSRVRPDSIRRTILLGGCGALAAGLISQPSGAAAASSEAKLAVSARVPKHATLKILAQPPSLNVTVADIARGYVDGPAPAQVLVTSNTGGYVLAIMTPGQFVRHVRVRGLGEEVELAAEGGTITRSLVGQGRTRATLDLNFRFHLAQEVTQGVYPWPVSLFVAPL